MTEIDDTRRKQRESGAVNARRVSTIAVSALAFLLVSLAFLYGIFLYAVPADRVPQRRVFGPPRLEADSAVKLQALLSGQKQQLRSYGWANAEHTLVAIPIDRAMGIIARRGAQAYAPVTGSEASNAPAGGRQ